MFPITVRDISDLAASAPAGVVVDGPRGRMRMTLAAFSACREMPSPFMVSTAAPRALLPRARAARRLRERKQGVPHG